MLDCELPEVRSFCFCFVSFHHYRFSIPSRYMAYNECSLHLLNEWVNEWRRDDEQMDGQIEGCLTSATVMLNIICAATQVSSHFDHQWSWEPSQDHHALLLMTFEIRSLRAVMRGEDWGESRTTKKKHRKHWSIQCREERPLSLHCESLEWPQK